MSWAAEEFKDIDLGDRRLNRRTVLLAERLAANPMDSIPQACGGWAETQAAYRFLAQDDVEWEAILAPHWQSAEVRMRAPVPSRHHGTGLQRAGHCRTGAALL